MPAAHTNTVTIANGESLSGASELNFTVGGTHMGVRETLVGIIMPSGWTAAGLTFQASADNSVFADMYTTAGSEIAVVVSTSRYIPLDPADFAGVAYLKVRSGTAAVPVNQGAARTITLVFRPVS